MKRNPLPRVGGKLTRRRTLAGGAGLVGAALVACQAPGQTEAPRLDAREVTLTYLTDWTGGARGEWVKQAMPRFTQEFPKIKVEVHNVTATGALALATTIITNAAGGTLQDTWHNENDVFQQLARQGALKDITPVLKSLRVNQNDIVSIPSGYTLQGKQYGLPLQLSLIIMMINKTLFKQNSVALPDKTTTYTQWLDLLRKVARPAEGIYGYLTNGAPGSWNQWMPMVWASGGDRWTPDLKKCLIDQAPMIEGLQYYADMIWRNQVGTPVDAKGAVIPQGISFANGNVACATSTSPGANVEQQVGGKFEWDIMYNPAGARTGKRGVATNVNAVCVSGDAARRGVFDQAVQLVAWISASKTAQDLVVETGASTPVYKPVLNSQKFLAGPPISQKSVVDMIPDWHDPQIFTGWIEFRDSTGNELMPAFANQKSIPDAAKEATRVGQLVLDRIPK